MKTFLAILLLLAPNLAFASLGDELIGYWPLDARDKNWPTFLDRSGEGRHGIATNMNETTSPIIGLFGQALTFDGGDDYVKVCDGTIAATLTNATVAIWFKTTVTFVTGGKSMYAERASSGSDIFKLDYGDNSGNASEPFFTWRNDANQLVQVRPPTVGGFNDNQWHHFAVVVEGSTATIYIDGTARNSGTLQAKNFTNANLECRIGDDATSSFNPTWLGSLDDFRIYERALSSGEIADLYRAGVGKPGGSFGTLLSLFFSLL